VLQGEREQASANKSLGRFDLADLPSAPRGVPQIEVTFDIDANGILNVSAADKATGKAQSIVIKASSGLSDEEVEAMVQDAEAHAEDDKKFKALVELRNQADNLIHSSEKSLKELADDMADDEKKSIEEAVSELKEALQGSDKAEIEAKLEVLNKASASMAERLYAKKSAEGQTAEGATDADDAGDASDSVQDETVVDAEFEEVKEDDDKK